MINREKIYSSLWEVAKQSSHFTTASRRLLHWSQVAPAEQPALFMVQMNELAAERQNVFDIQSPIYTLRVEFYIYVYAINEYEAAAIQLNSLIDALEHALAADPVSGVNDLNLEGEVLWVRINGEIRTSEGVLDPQAVAIVPIEIRCV